MSGRLFVIIYGHFLQWWFVFKKPNAKTNKMESQLNPYLYPFLLNSKKRINWLMGGASSSKSWTIVQYLILEKLCKQHDIGIMCLRKTLPACRRSCLDLFLYWLKRFNIPYHLNKSELIMTCGLNNKVYFDSLDDIEKKKSIEGVNYIWMEEITQFKAREFLRLNIGCRAINPNGMNQIFCSFNPIDPIGNEWIKKRTDNPNKDEQVIVVTYEHNPFLTQADRDQIDMLADQDYEYDKIYRQGLWATPTCLIFTKWEITRKWPKSDKVDEIVYGLDFGFNNPTALHELCISDNVLYEREHIYQSHLTTTELITKMNNLNINKNAPMIGDCSDPRMIKDIRGAGYNCRGCRKGADSVRRSIELVKRHTPYIDYNSPNLLEEIQGYKWKVDKDENVLDEPVKFRDHLMDARRYAYEWMFDKTNAGMTTSAKATADERKNVKLVPAGAHSNEQIRDAFEHGNDASEMWNEFGED